MADRKEVEARLLLQLARVILDTGITQDQLTMHLSRPYIAKMFSTPIATLDAGKTAFDAACAGKSAGDLEATKGVAPVTDTSVRRPVVKIVGNQIMVDDWFLGLHWALGQQSMMIDARIVQDFVISLVGYVRAATSSVVEALCEIGQGHPHELESTDLIKFILHSHCCPVAWGEGSDGSIRRATMVAYESGDPPVKVAWQSFGPTDGLGKEFPALVVRDRPFVFSDVTSFYDRTQRSF